MTDHLTAAQCRQRSLHFAGSPQAWELWPFLPLVRRRPGQPEELGVLFDALHACGLTGYYPAVFLCNLFQMPRKLEEFLALPKEAFDTLEELLDAGWRVD